MRQWWESELPVIVSLRDEAASFRTLARNQQHNYNEHDHRASLDRLYELLQLPRVKSLQIDCPVGQRLQQLEAVLAHLGTHGCVGMNPGDVRVTEWAATWPRFNAGVTRPMIGYSPVRPNNQSESR